MEPFWGLLVSGQDSSQFEPTIQNILLDNLYE